MQRIYCVNCAARPDPNGHVPDPISKGDEMSSILGRFLSRLGGAIKEVGDAAGDLVEDSIQTVFHHLDKRASDARWEKEKKEIPILCKKYGLSAPDLTNDEACIKALDRLGRLDASRSWILRICAEHNLKVPSLRTAAEIEREDKRLSDAGYDS